MAAEKPPFSEKVPRTSQDGTIHESVDEQFEREATPQDKDWKEFEVTIPVDDPQHPLNWGRTRRWYITIMSGILVLNATFASSMPSGQIPDMEKYFTFSDEVATLMISLFVAGYCVGPLVWGPLSEQIGRKPVFILAFFPYVCFSVGCALSKNTGSILVFRFLSGTFAAAPLANSGAIMSDVWDARTRGKAFALFTLAPFAGPSVAPVCSGWMAVAGVTWRWSFWVLALFSGTCLIMIIFTIPETYLPVLAVQRAKQKRKETGDNRYWAPLERNKASASAHARRILGRPFKILFAEPMLMAITVYMSFIYGCIYLLFEAYPIVFTEGHHFNEGVSGLMYLPLFVGGTTGVVLYLLIFNPRYERQMAKHAPNPVPPEARLELAMWGAPLFAIAFFWFGWTSYPRINYWAPMMAGLPLGWGTIWIFLAMFNYMIDAYLYAAASALSSNTVCRSIFGASFPLFATQMFNNLNPRWASTLLGCLALVCLPIPIVLHRYGATLRLKSKYAPSKPVLSKAAEAQAEAEANGANAV